MTKNLPQTVVPAITVKDVAVYLNVDERTIYRPAQKGKLPACKVAGAWRFELADIQKWVAAQKVVAVAAGTKKVKGVVT